MNFTHDEWLERAIEAFPEMIGTQPYQITDLDKGGSDRRYWRIAGSKGSLIASHYTEARADNFKFVPVTRILERRHVNVPNLLRWEENERILWLSDLGETDLWSFRNEPWEVRKNLYQKALFQVGILHRTSPVHLTPDEAAVLEPPFDEKLYLWEQEYFWQHLVKPLLGNEAPEFHEPWLVQLRTTLAELPRNLVHRDFQSQNIMIRDNDAWLIDYQGLRWGRPEYDLASLLHDPYTQLQEEEKESLLDFYVETISEKPPQETRDLMPLLSAQRLMQALGAYGNLGWRQGKTSFLQHIPTALHTIRNAVSPCPWLNPLAELSERLLRQLPRHISL